MTPILKDDSLKLAKKILDSVNISEIVINDLGLLEYLIKKHPEIKINIGRVLATSLLSSLKFGETKKIISSHANAIEIDYLIWKKLPNLTKKIHFHYPFSYLTHTFNCNFKIGKKCTCYDSYQKIKSRISSDMYSKSDAYFLYNKKIPENPNISRIILIN